MDKLPKRRWISLRVHFREHNVLEQKQQVGYGNNRQVDEEVDKAYIVEPPSHNFNGESVEHVGRDSYTHSCYKMDCLEILHESMDYFCGRFSCTAALFQFVHCLCILMVDPPSGLYVSCSLQCMYN